MVKIELIFTSQPDDTSVPGVINAAVQVEFKATGLDTPLSTRRICTDR
ncbi:hypothetical protein [Salmonella enterica]|nr:hypothetical protein [Salmonella enterica]